MSTVYDKTDNYALNLYGDSDPADLRDGYNGSMRTIDTTLETHLDRIEGVESRETHNEGVVKALLGDNTVDAATTSKTKWDNAATDSTDSMAALTALDAETAAKATTAKAKWDKASTDAAKAVTDAATATAKATANTEALTALKNTIDTHTTDIAGIKTDYATKQYVNSTFLKHANIAVAKISNADFTINANVTTPVKITFDEPDSVTSFDDEDGVITLSTLRDHMTVSRDGIYLISAEARFGGITFTDDDSYRGLELLVYINDNLMATAPAAIVAGANGSIRGAQYSAFPCRPYKLTANDEISLKYRLNGPTSEISGKISYCALSMFRISKQ